MKKIFWVIGIVITIILILCFIWYYFIDCVGRWEEIKEDEHCCFDLDKQSTKLGKNLCVPSGVMIS